MAKKWLLGITLLLMLAVAGTRFWLGFDNPMQMLGSIAQVLLIVVGARLYLRLDNARRRRAILDAYADRALARQASRRRRVAATAPEAHTMLPIPAHS